jgi:hypothetical protein
MKNKNIENPLDRIKLMMGYQLGKTLNENLKETKINLLSEEFINRDLVKLAQEWGIEAKGTLETVIAKDAQTIANELKTAAKDGTNAIAKFNKEEIFRRIVQDSRKADRVLSQGEMTAIKNDVEAKTNAALAKVGKPPVKPRTPRKSKNTNPKDTNVNTNTNNAKGGNATAQVGGDVVGNSQKVTFNIYTNPSEAVKDISKVREEAKIEGDTKTEQRLKELEDLIRKRPSRFQKWLDFTEKHPRFTRLLTYLGLGAIGYGAYKLFFQNTTPEEVKRVTFNNCVGNLIDDAGTTIRATSGGDPVIQVTKTGNQEYDSKGGLLFYNNGRVFMKDQSNRGYWSCKGNKTVVAESQLLNESEIDPQTFNNYVDDIGTYLARYVTEGNLQSVKQILLKIKGNTYQGKNAIGEFLKFYQLQNSSTFVDDVNSVGVKTFIVTGTKLKEEILQIVGSASAGKNGGDGNSATGVDSIINIKWDKGGVKTGGGDGGGNIKPKKTYYDCSGVNLDTTPLTYGCKDQKIAQIQACLGVDTDGKFGPNTRNALIDKSYDITNGITKEIYDKVIAACKKGETAQTAGSTEGGADVNYLRNPIKLDLGPTPELPKFSTNTETSENFYNRLVTNGNFKAGTIGDNRVKYKGPDLNVDDLKKLNDFITSNGYSLIKTKDKGAQYGGGENDKYVWQKSE